MVIVLIAFTLGLVVGVLGMLPRWWRGRKTAASRGIPASKTQSDTSQVTSTTAASPSPELILNRDGH